jgi:hypothetical protein
MTTLAHCACSSKAGLIGVTFGDQAGRYLLRLMHRDGVCLQSASIFFEKWKQAEQDKTYQVLK